MPSGKVNLNLFFGIILWMFSFSSCGPKLETIPYTPVNIYIPFVTIANVGVDQSYVIVGGTRGIILFRKYVDVWEAYDMACMYRPRSEPCTIMKDKTGLTPQCPCCKSTYSLLLEGSPQSGPAQQGLHPYNVYLNSDGTIIQITN